MLADIFYFLLTLSILVTFHEYGHFWVARRCGVQVQRFSVGFGQPLWRRVGADGTEYVVASIPLGGYVKMLDESEGSVAPAIAHQAFNRQSALRRTAIVAAGPLANFLLAVFVYALVFMLGVPGYKPLVGEVVEGSAAERAGMRSGEFIVAIDERPVNSQQQVVEQLLRRLGDSGELSIELRGPEALEGRPVRLPLASWLAGDKSPDPFASLGFYFWSPAAEPVVEQVLPDSPAHRAGLQAGDRITAIDDVAISQWLDIGKQLKPAYGRVLPVTVMRGEQQLELSVQVAEHRNQQGEREGRIGISVALPTMPDELFVVERFGPVTATIKGVEKTGEMILYTLDSLKKMLVGLISPTHLGGPVTIARFASLSAEAGLDSYLQMLAMLSISLGIFNLLPIPVLDGGHLLIIAVQSIIRRPVPDKLLHAVQQIGLSLLLGIMVFAIYNDITRL